MRTGPGLIGVLLLLLAFACRGGAEASSVVTDTGDAHHRMRGMLEHECVEPGGRQVLTVEAEGALAVTYTSTYADGGSGRPEPQGAGYGGEGNLDLEPAGEGQERAAASRSWSVAGDAPAGIVVVYVSALLTGFEGASPDDALTRLMLSFWLVGPGEECPWSGGAPPEVVTDTGTAHPEVRGALEHACLSAGRRQVLRVELERDGVVSHVSVYANGENGRPRPNGGGYGGSGLASVLAGGPAEMAWTIEDDAPTGIVTVLVSTTIPEQDPVDQRLAFRLLGPREECP